MYCGLTPEQEKHFKKLEAAYKACVKAGIYFVNVYGRLEAFDSAIVEEYSDRDHGLCEGDDDVINADDASTYHTFRIPNEWADDDHLVQLTRKGVERKNNPE